MRCPSSIRRASNPGGRAGEGDRNALASRTETIRTNCHRAKRHYQFGYPHRILIDGDAPILREKDILTPETANTPVKRIYLCVQMMYLENDIPKYQDLYFGFIGELIEAVPSFREQIEEVSKLILSGALYKALRELRGLMKREDDLLR